MKFSFPLVLAASAAASPIMTIRDVLDNADTFCKGWDLTTPEGAKKLWDETGAGATLDLFIKAQWEHETRWIHNLENGIAGIDGTSTVDGCSTLGTQCTPLNGKNCTTVFKEYGPGATGKNMYWIFQAAKGLHEKFAEIHLQLLDQAFITSMQIDTMKSDFGGDEKNTAEIYTWLSAACGMGSAIGGMVPGAGEGIAFGFDVLGGIFDILSETQADSGVDTSTISNALSGIYQNATTQLQTTLRIALGGGTSNTEYDTLPAPVWDTLQSKVAKFFNGGWFLVENDSEAVRVVLETMKNNLKAKIANQIMEAAHLVLVADKSSNAQTRETCGYSTGRQWLKGKDGKEYCYYIKTYENKEFGSVDESIYEAMAKYGLGNREMFYNSVIDCAINGASGGIDTSAVNWGEVPRCYFNLPTYYVWTTTNGKGCGSPFDNPSTCTHLESSSFP